MIKLSIFDFNYDYTDRLIINDEVKNRLRCIFESAIFTYYPTENELDIESISHLFPGPFVRYKDKKEILNILLDIKDILADSILRQQLKPLHIYILYMLNYDYYELQKELIKFGDIKKSELIPENVQKILLSSKTLSNEEKETIEYWFTYGYEGDIQEYYDEYYLIEDVEYGENQFAAIALEFLKTNKICEEDLKALLEGIAFVPKDIADICSEIIESRKFILFKGTLDEQAESQIRDLSNAQAGEKRHDVFISYASQEECIAAQLADKLQEVGVIVWFAKNNIKIGDNIKLSIEKGLQDSKYAIVILSENYLDKYWTNNELNALFELEEDGNKKILPLTYNLSHERLKEKSILLANKLCLSINKKNIAEVAVKIVEDISTLSNKQIIQ